MSEEIPGELETMVEEEIMENDETSSKRKIPVETQEDDVKEKKETKKKTKQKKEKEKKNKGKHKYQNITFNNKGTF